MKNKTIKFLTCILVAIMLVLAIGQTMVFAARKAFMLS